MAFITLAGESLVAQRKAAEQPLNITEFIFANIPGLDPNAPVNRSEPMPAAAHIVYQVSIPDWASGYVNPNQVVYSAQIGSDIGDWDYNWIGLQADDGTLFAASYVPLQQKRRNIPPLQTGNNITRNFLVAFDGAKAITGLTVDASTWQIDYTIRLFGIDERERLSNRDIYGRSAFFGTGFEVAIDSGVHQVKSGIGYGEGIRIENASHVSVSPPGFPTTLYLDCCLERQLSDVQGVWKVAFGTDLADYDDSVHTRHYLVPVAHLPDPNTVTDLRPVLQKSAQGLLDDIQAAIPSRTWLYYLCQI